MSGCAVDPDIAQHAVVESAEHVPAAGPLLP
jgi:hypothetical protein